MRKYESDPLRRGLEHGAPTITVSATVANFTQIFCFGLLNAYLQGVLVLRNKLIGTWRLVSFVDRDGSDGLISYPQGENALGLIIYTADGYMSVQIMTADRPNYDWPLASCATTAQAAAAARGYLAYSGPYSVDEATGEIRHEAMLSLVPNYVGAIHLRHSRLDGDRLTLSAELTLPDGMTLWSTLVWVRAASSRRVLNMEGSST